MIYPRVYENKTKYFANTYHSMVSFLIEAESYDLKKYLPSPIPLSQPIMMNDIDDPDIDIDFYKHGHPDLELII